MPSLKLRLEALTQVAPSQNAVEAPLETSRRCVGAFVPMPTKPAPEMRIASRDGETLKRCAVPPVWYAIELSAAMKIVAVIGGAPPGSERSKLRFNVSPVLFVSSRRI